MCGSVGPSLGLGPFVRPHNCCAGTSRRGDGGRSALRVEEVDMGFSEFLSWASGPGVAAIVALLLSWLIEYWPRYKLLEPKLKRLVFGALCFIVPVIGALLRAATGQVTLTFDPLIWQALVAGAAAFGAGTALHTPKLLNAAEAEVAREAVRQFRESLRS